MNEFFDAVVVGGGPAGLTAGIYLMRAGIKSVLLEKQLIGGAPLNTEHIENYPGFPDGVSGRELMGRMAEQAKNVGLEIAEFSQVQRIEVKDGSFFTSVDGKTYESRGLIVATGTEPTKLGIPGEDQLVGRGISYCATCDGMFFRGLAVAVVGGGDTALSEALSLANIVRKVYLIHRRDRFRAQQILQDRARKSGNIEFLLNKVPVRVNGIDQVESISLRDTVSNEVSDLPVSGVFLYVGSRPDTAFLEGLADRDGGGFVLTDEELATRTPGLFVAGDARRKSLRQISTAVGDGAVAAVNVERYILEKRNT